MRGFKQDAQDFLVDLAANNERDWFHANKLRYEAAIKKPAKLFSEDMAEALGDLTGQSFQPKIFRINRDLRFSKDKTPYNTHVRMSWTPQIDHPAPPAFMFSLEPVEIIRGAGVFDLKGAALDHWRERVDSEAGAALASTLTSLEKQGVRLSEPSLKRVPAPYDKDHPREHLLRTKGLNVWLDGHDIGTANVDGCLTRFKHVKPVFDWLTE